MTREESNAVIAKRTRTGGHRPCPPPDYTKDHDALSAAEVEVYGNDYDITWSHDGLEDAHRKATKGDCGSFAVVKIGSRLPTNNYESSYCSEELTARAELLALVISIQGKSAT